MSRIYEALRRAEAEKAAAQAAVSSGVVAEDTWAEPLITVFPQHQTYLEPLPESMPETAPESAAGPPLPPPRPLGRFAEAQVPPPNKTGSQTGSNELLRTPGIQAPSLASTLTEPSAAPPSTHLSIVDLDRIASDRWTPALKHLPAVQERGRTVEQFRSLRSRMQEFRGANRLKSILVTSGLPQEGKSFIAVNLAISLARHKISNVLLIDGDMRRSSLHTVLGCPNDGPGLTEYLSGEASLQQILKRPAPNPDGAPLPLGFASLVFIGAGREADKAADLSGNHRFEELMATVAPLFDWVIVDSSPVNLVSDGVNLARACDGVLLIARGEVTKFETAQQAVAALESARVLGFVLNAVSNSNAATGYYDYDSVPEKQVKSRSKETTH